MGAWLAALVLLVWIGIGGLVGFFVSRLRVCPAVALATLLPPIVGFVFLLRFC